MVLRSELIAPLATLALGFMVACGGDPASSGSPEPDGGTGTGKTGADGGGASDDGTPGSGSSHGGDDDAGGSSQGDADATSPGDAGGTRDAGASDGGVPSATGCKRGIASNKAPTAALAPTASSPGVSWWYNWAISGTGAAPGIEFVPMIWDGKTAKDALPAGARYVLGFNEPNFKAQAKLSPQDAAALWPDIEAHAKAAGIPLVSPAVNFCGSAMDSSNCTTATITDPYTYLKDFFAACAGCKVDYVAVHWYNCDLPSLKAYIEGNTSTGGGLEGFVQFGKPIWLTEFSCGGGSSVANQTAYMKAAVPYLEGNAHIARYSWFSAGPIPNAQLMKSDGSLTDLGQTYVSLPESCRP